MKKSIIAAGASAVALAAMPVVGVFAAAADPAGFTDTLKISINDSCTFTRTLTTSDSTNVTITTGSEAAAIASATMTASQSITGFGVSTMNAKCNNAKGYKITGTFTDLTGYTDNGKQTTLNGNKKIAYGGAATLAAGTWVARLGDAETGLASGTSGNVASTTTSDNMSSGSTYVVTYDVELAADQAAGYYEGTASYVFAQNS